MKIRDERTEEQKKSHRCLIVGTDSFLSGWGEAEGGKSYAAWACRVEDKDRVFNWVAKRSDMKRVREIYEAEGETYRPTGVGHCAIYVVEDGHPALK